MVFAPLRKRTSAGHLVAFEVLGVGLLVDPALADRLFPRVKDRLRLGFGVLQRLAAAAAATRQNERSESAADNEGGVTAEHEGARHFLSDGAVIGRTGVEAWFRRFKSPRCWHAGLVDVLTVEPYEEYGWAAGRAAKLRQSPSCAGGITHASAHRWPQATRLARPEVSRVTSPLTRLPGAVPHGDPQSGRWTCVLALPSDAHQTGEHRERGQIALWSIAGGAFRFLCRLSAITREPPHRAGCEPAECDGFEDLSACRTARRFPSPAAPRRQSPCVRSGARRARGGSRAPPARTSAVHVSAGT